MIKMGGISFVLFAMMAGSAVAQDVAAVDPTVGLPGIQPVVGQCEIVAAAPETGDPTDGICIGATRSFVAGLAGLPVTEADQSIANLVLALAPLAQNDATCNAFDDEIAEAIRFAGASASTPEQLAQLNEIAQTIDDCDDGVTAQIPDPLLGGGDGSFSPS